MIAVTSPSSASIGGHQCGGELSLARMILLNSTTFRVLRLALRYLPELKGKDVAH